MKISLTPADKYFSLCVRERNNNKCEICGTTEGVQCCHYESRGNWATRFDPDNAFCFCYGHHVYMDGHKFKFLDLFINNRRGNAYTNVRMRSNDLTLGKLIKQTKGKGAIAKFYRDQYERMLEKRSRGVTGWIDFEMFVP